MHSLEFEVFKIISLKIGLVSSVPRWNMIRVTATTVMKIACDVNFKSGLYCRRQNIVCKALGRFGSFLKLYMSIQIETFMHAITSHKKQRAKYQTEMLLRIAKTAILVRSSNYKYSFQLKKTPSNCRH